MKHAPAARPSSSQGAASTASATGDRSSSLLFSAIVTPLLFGVMFTVTAERRKSADEIALPVAGRRVRAGVRRVAEAADRCHVVTAPADPERCRPRSGLRTSSSSSTPISNGTWSRARAGAGQAGQRRDARQRPTEGGAGAKPDCRLLADGWRAAPHHPRCRAARRHGHPDRGSRGLELATATGDPVEHPAAAARAGGPHRRHADRHRFDGRRARTRVARAAAAQSRAGVALAAGKWLAASLFGCGAVHLLDAADDQRDAARPLARPRCAVHA